MSGRDHRTNRNHYKKVEHQGSVTIDAGDFREMMNALLDEYGSQVLTVTEQVAQKTTREARLDLRHVPKDVVGGTGKYSRGWRASFQTDKLNVKAVVYNSSEWQLTHLLEYGHQVKRGGRTIGDADAHPHIDPVKKWAYDEFEKRLKEELSKI